MLRLVWPTKTCFGSLYERRGRLGGCARAHYPMRIVSERALKYPGVQLGSLVDCRKDAGTKRWDKTSRDPALRLVEGPAEALVEYAWFCGHCAAPSPGSEPSRPHGSRVPLVRARAAARDPRRRAPEPARRVPGRRLARCSSRPSRSRPSDCSASARRWPSTGRSPSCSSRPTPRRAARARSPPRSPSAMAERRAGSRVRAAVEHLRCPDAGADRGLRAAARRAGRARRRAAARACVSSSS